MELRINGRNIKISQEQFDIDTKALNAYENNDYATALKLYSQLIQMSPKAHQYYQFRGTVYEDMGNDSFAKKDFEKAIDLEPTNTVALYRLGMVYQRMGDLRTAVIYLKKANEHIHTYQDLMGNSYNNILW